MSRESLSGKVSVGGRGSLYRVVKSGRCASYWNAFLYASKFRNIVKNPAHVKNAELHNCTF